MAPNLKRKLEIENEIESSTKKRTLLNGDSNVDFRASLFELKVKQSYINSYAQSQPYKHGVIENLISEDLLRSVRLEIQDNLSFTLKETDIYKIYQSGDLANLDGLDDSSLARLPSLLKLRNALYSPRFREYLSDVTQAGPLSGKKTDMAINVYTPGCHLLCHDDVIGSRRVSYILYLTDPDKQWEKEWGGALRLYPTTIVKSEDGQELKTPSVDPTVSIPPAFNQLSFFAVQPGESFHDVEEVYAGASAEDDKLRVRTAISGWYHIPQEGEEGFEPGLEARLAEKSSLMQLKGKANELDQPRVNIESYKQDLETETKSTAAAYDDEFTADDLNFLLRYISPNYLVPETLDQVSAIFEEESSLRLAEFLHPEFSSEIKDYITTAEARPEHPQTPQTGTEMERDVWPVARPPHKHRFLYQQAQPISTADTPQMPIQDLLENLIPSQPFRKWLAHATGLSILDHSSLARRFRRGKDYTLATGYEDEDSRLEITLGLTPTPGWGEEDEKEQGEENDAAQEEKPAEEKTIEGESANPPTSPGITEEGKSIPAKDSASTSDPTADPPMTTTPTPLTQDTNPAVGGYEVYMATDLPPNDPNHPTTTSDDDAAIYKSHTDADPHDDGVLFSMEARWNTLSMVLRDRGVLRFTKYVSQAAKGDRWDVVGEFGVSDVGGDGWDGEVEGGVYGLDTIEEEEVSTELDGEGDDVTEEESSGDER
ncbi:MAG: hypothetical protein M1824_004260 [Vezdaea acicularis]|nr:MAG: hypothetical protein M1824_004260 [Vezdaea acicularis]